MMREVVVLLVHLSARLADLLGTRGTRAVVAENLIFKQQLLVIQRSRRRAPNLRPSDRLLLGFLSRFLEPRRLVRAAVILNAGSLVASFCGAPDREPTAGVLGSSVLLEYSGPGTKAGAVQNLFQQIPSAPRFAR